LTRRDGTCSVEFGIARHLFVLLGVWLPEDGFSLLLAVPNGHDGEVNILAEPGLRPQRFVVIIVAESVVFVIVFIVELFQLRSSLAGAGKLVNGRGR
jgi:hypothetical protein